MSKKHLNRLVALKVKVLSRQNAPLSAAYCKLAAAGGHTYPESFFSP
jgi:hypothetical protein